ncbi:sensor histidine kinase [Microbacterium maritypicum]|uniref:GAF domain-containing protein n=1 Tax=Microbacterium maritypicum TaxID=33918 RepID=A0ACD4BAI5_MICMQ|nr:GAF domain-containing protein [Microbacterium liquefaciens]UTT54691.1 GAF domain-containing protein [Microbacterium liquefaciens]
MDDEELRFPDQRRSELESTIGELVERAQHVLSAQGRLRSLLRASQAVVEDLELEQVLRHIVEAAVTLVDAQYGALGVIDREGRLEQFIHVGMPDDVAARIGHLPEGHGVLGAVIESAHPIRLVDLGADPRSVGLPAHHPVMRTFLGVPIRVRGEIYGNLYLTNRTGGEFTDEDEELVLALATTAAIAIDNARRYEESRRLQRLSRALAEVSAALLSPETGDVFGVVAEKVASVIDADLVLIVAPGPDGKRLQVKTARGVGAERIEGTEVPDGDSLISRAMGGGAVISASGPADEPSFNGHIPGGSTIGVPLLVEGAPGGALCVVRDERQRHFSSEDLSVLSEFAAQAGIAVALAHARADRQRLDLIEDRARIARDLHDNVIQRLFGTGLGLQALAATTPDRAEAISAHAGEIDAAISDFRTAIFALQTTDPESVRHRLLDVVGEFTPSLRSAPRVSFSGPVDLLVTGPLGEDIVAVVRESLSNIARHAHATTSEVIVAVTASHVTVVVDDDGIGMPENPERVSGTANLEMRARAHGGTFTVAARDLGGTRVRWRAPFEAETTGSR